ncbi:GIDE domain-containing protein [Bailinhaonella thermotolerans]|uniref:RING-type E3 ubiquitin transferase n=1 Tax=Bailinhaonella thermotolerans TaxID=1070861 RepID=A0A3A4B9J0_9ACTN|nr:GIDE domain-containing protein [Bailinhaonella thermotolerans]RJL30848.1 hypothetical protein D5H75_21315 [Bailinhaonella thermotolerans]
MEPTTVFALVLAVLGVAAIAWGVTAQIRHRAMAAAPTIGCGDVRDVADDTGAVTCEVKGTAGPGPGGLLKAPFSGTPCLWHRTVVKRRYRATERDSQGRSRTVTKSETVSDERSFEPFRITDVSGEVLIYPEKAGVDRPTESVDRFERKAAEPLPADGGFGEIALAIGARLLDGDDTIGFEYHEWILTEGTPVYALGAATRDLTRDAVAIRPPARGPYIISTRTEEQLAGSSRIQMFAGYGLGAALLLAAAALPTVFAVHRIPL